MSVLNPGITHTMIDGAAFKEEVESKDIMAVPTVYLNGESFGSGRMTLEEILAKMGNGPDASELSDKDPYDVLVVGGGLLVQVQQFTQHVKASALVSLLSASVVK